MAAFRKVIIIDDDEIFLLLTELLMQSEDFAEEIIKFEYAQKALDYLKSVTTVEPPEVLFLDINMPLMDGWEFMEAFEKSEMNNIMIYISSSSINPKDYEKAEKNPFIKGFISKPLDAEKLKKIETAVIK